MPVAAVQREGSFEMDVVWWRALWRRLHRPSHHTVVRELRIAAEARDAHALSSLLDIDVSVVVESGDADRPDVRMVNGKYDAVPLLIHGIAQPGIVVTERSVNGQAGLLLRRDGNTTAVTVDFAGPLIAAVWIRLSSHRRRTAAS